MRLRPQHQLTLALFFGCMAELRATSA